MVSMSSNTRNNPVEDMESHLPLRIRRYELRDDAVAAGQWRGGIGSVREFEFLADGGFSIEGEGHKYRPWGHDGGAEGFTARLHVESRRNGPTELPSKVPYYKVQAGDRLTAYGPSGGGYGPPGARERQAVNDDVLDGYLTASAARQMYGAKGADDDTKPIK